MYLTVKQELKHLTRSEFETLKDLCHTAKNIYNVALYNIRQKYFEIDAYLGYNENYHLCKANENYKILNANMAQQVIKRAHQDFNSFYGLLKLKEQGAYSAAVSMPRYLPKDGYAVLEIAGGEVSLQDGRLVLPYSCGYRKSHAPITVVMPPIIKGKTVKGYRSV